MLIKKTKKRKEEKNKKACMSVEEKRRSLGEKERKGL
jgi:hypothetical protein